MKKHVRFIAAVVSVMALAMTGCGSSSSNGSQSAGTGTAGSAADSSYVVIGQASEVANLNPMEYPRTPDSNVQAMIFSYLVQPDEELNFKPDLAESWDISEDGTVYTFHLRNDVTWHDGEAFTADDVVFTLTSLADPSYVGGNDGRVMTIVGAKDYQAGTADSISGINKVDDYTVEITLESANSAFMANMYTAILPEHILAGETPGDWENDDFNRNPIGTGKYKFVEWQSGQYIKLVRNDDYYGEIPSIQDVTVQFGDETTLVAALLNGEIDVLYNLPTAEVENVDAVDTASVYTNEQMTVQYIGCNMLNDTLSDLRVRQALSYGLDKTTIIDTVFGTEYASACDDIFPANHWSHSENVTTYSYDPEKAKSLLEEAGYTMNASTGYYEKDGKTLHLTYDMSTSTTGEEIATLIQQQWKEIGIEVEVIEQDFATLAYTKLLPDQGQAETTGDSYQLYALGFGVEVDPNEYNEYLSANTGAGSWNFGHYNNEEINKLFADQLLETDPDARAEIFHQIADIESQDIYWIPLYSNAATTGVGSRVENFVADYRGITYLIEKWSIAE